MGKEENLVCQQNPDVLKCFHYGSQYQQHKI